MPNKSGQLTETERQNQVREYLTLQGWFVIRNQQGLGCHKGLPDLTVIKDKRVVQIEMKMPKGTLSEWQKKFRDNWIGHGGQYIVLRSLDEAIEFIKTGKARSE